MGPIGHIKNTAEYAIRCGMPLERREKIWRKMLPKKPRLTPKNFGISPSNRPNPEMA